MAVKDVIILKLVETYANLTVINPALGNGQEVIVDELASTYFVTNKPKKIGDGSTLFNALVFIDLVEVTTDANYDLTQTYIAINNNRIQITNTHATNTISLTGTSFTLGPLATGSYKRISGTWYETGNYGQLEPWFITTTYGLDWIVVNSAEVFISIQAGNTGNTPVGGIGDLWWDKWPKAADVPIIDTGGYYTATNVETALAEKGQFIDQDVKTTAAPTFNGVQTDGTVLKTKVIEIGDWDMDADTSTTVTHGVADWKKIRSVSCIIRNDAETLHISLWKAILGEVQGGVGNIATLTITLERLLSGYFDSTIFDDTSYNRGWLTITYEV